MNTLDGLICSMEVVRDAAWAKNTDKAHEAVTVFLMEFAAFFGIHSDFFKKTLPALEQLNEHIEKEQFDEAGALAVAFLARMRHAKEANT